MKKLILCSFLTLSLSIYAFKIEPPKVTLKETKVKAPFGTTKIKTPDFSKCASFIITDFGAVKGDQNKTSQAIARAIDAANKDGGGTVIIPEGEWLTGKVHFKSNVNLHLNKGALLLFSDNPNDYLPAVHSTWEGLECYNYSPLIYAYKCKNVAITGEGTIKAKMDFWKKWAGRPAGHMNSLKRLYNMSGQNVPVEQRVMVNDTANLRPQLIQFNQSENILIEGVSIRNSPFWTVHTYLSKDIVLRNLDIYAHGHNNDGFDPEMSQNILVENVTFDQGDDAIAAKSGRNPEGWRSKTPTKNLIIRNCTIKNGHQLLAVGSELSGGIENVFIDNCELLEGSSTFNLIFIKTNERMGGYVKNIYVQNIKGDKVRDGILGIETDVLYQWKNLVPTVERRLTPISDVYLTNVQAKNVQFISRIKGEKELPIKNINLKNVAAESISGKEKYISENVENFNVSTKTK
ncbi:glycoside hydrolase family 28 protein [Flavobacterium seoulense]|uniref:Polygalacturonase n=1 Tax=Flavobacterium seoulense TaxID=1492738 RepID=A0A066WNY3_9FLAO|nr:glycoside hydrolase family 28 protein [Flavobacterium seoulense]KDN55737.1 polygalacturonase [Flavobacterium seoulense]